MRMYRVSIVFLLNGPPPGSTRTDTLCPSPDLFRSAPLEWQKSRPRNVIAAGGWAYHSPIETPHEKPPLKGAGRFLPDYEAGIDAALCTMASLLRLDRKSTRLNSSH